MNPTAASGPGRRAPLGAWVAGARPKTLAAAVAPVLAAAGLAAAAGSLRPLPLMATLVTALLLQVGVNFANDVNDFRRGADRTGRVGPLRVTEAGLLSPRAVTAGAATCFAAAEGLSLYLGAVSGPVIPVVCLIAIAAALTYTGGPWPYGYHGLGDLFVFGFFGIAAVLGAVYVQTLRVGPADVLAAVAMGLLADAILVANNMRDLDSDRLAGKGTLAVRLGHGGARIHYGAAMLLPYLLPLGMWALGGGGPALWLPWLSLPLAIATVRRANRTREPGALGPLLARTGAVQVLFGLLFALGQVL